MTCQKCGQCCRQINFQVPLDPVLGEFFSAHYGRPIARTGLHIDHVCIQLKENNLCKIYETRPEYCRDFQCEHPDMVVVRTK